LATALRSEGGSEAIDVPPKKFSTDNISWRLVISEFVLRREEVKLGLGRP
jgi:hypothetical protein